MKYFSAPTTNAGTGTRNAYLALFSKAPYCQGCGPYAFADSATTLLVRYFRAPTKARRANVYLFDTISCEMLEKHYSKTPEATALAIAEGYCQPNEKPGKPLAMTGQKRPGGWMITTPTDYTIVYFS